uniref:Uncharacterized protein n=1 Tax=Arundo donax TaxID=35708 RepID=A0A0A8Y9Q6_ARUDO
MCLHYLAILHRKLMEQWARKQ